MTETRPCPTCGGQMVRRSREARSTFERRVTCSPECRSQSRPDIDTDYTVDDRGCWVWQGRLDANGYGKAYDPTQPAGNRVDWAHRISYRRHVGEIPAGLELDHTCSNPPCINPDHLEPVTRAEHVARTVRRRGSLERQAFAVGLKQMNLTYQEIADALGMASRSSAAAMVNAAIANGLVEPHEVPRRQTLTEIERDEIRDLYAAGVPQLELSAWYQVDDSQISRICSGRSSGHTPEDRARLARARKRAS